MRNIEKKAGLWHSKLALAVDVNTGGHRWPPMDPPVASGGDGDRWLEPWFDLVPGNCDIRYLINIEKFRRSDQTSTLADAQQII